MADLTRFAESEPDLLDLRRSHGLEEVTGTSVTFELLLHPALSLESLEDKRAGIELLSFRPTGEGAGVAVVFVPEGKLGIFEKKLEAYLMVTEYRISIELCTVCAISRLW